MKNTPIIFLQIVLLLVGIGAVGFLLWEPHLEGRNANATLFQIYFEDPFLAYVYIGSIPFFVGLFQVSKVLRFMQEGRIFSHEAVKALQLVKCCALSIVGFVAVGEIVIMMNTSDDRAGGVAMGILIAFCSLVVAAAATMSARILQNAIITTSAKGLPGEATGTIVRPQK